VKRNTAKKCSIATAEPQASLAHRMVGELLPLVIISIITMAARSSLADHYVIPSGSMEHTLVPGDHVVVDKLSYGVRIPFTGIELAPGESPRRGEVVIFDSPSDGERLIKRIVAVGGDHVSLVAGELRIDGRSVRDRHEENIEHFGERVAHLNLDHGGGRDIAPMVVPADQLLVVGDARGNSKDGRYFGLISRDLPYGKAKGVIYRRGEGLVWKDL
jgi:signal peptidase I